MVPQKMVNLASEFNILEQVHTFECDVQEYYQHIEINFTKFSRYSLDHGLHFLNHNQLSNFDFSVEDRGWGIQNQGFRTRNSRTAFFHSYQNSPLKRQSLMNAS